MLRVGGDYGARVQWKNGGAREEKNAANDCCQTLTAMLSQFGTGSVSVSGSKEVLCKPAPSVAASSVAQALLACLWSKAGVEALAALVWLISVSVLGPAWLIACA